MSISLSGGNYTVTDSGVATLTGNGSCTIVANVAICSAANVTRLSVETGPGNDVAVINAPTPTSLRGDAGDDNLTGSPVADDIRGYEGNDTLDGRGGDDEIYGEGWFTGPSPLWQNTMRGGPGNDTLYGGGGDDPLIEGGPGDDRLYGYAGNDLNIDGGDGSDLVSGGDGTDLLQGGADSDDVGAEAPSDPVFLGSSPAEQGNDTLDGGSGDDTLRAGPGGAGDGDLLSGGDGRDLVTYEQRGQSVAASIDSIPNDGSAGEADNIAINVESLVGGSGDDVLIGSDQDNSLDGRGGADVLDGRAGNDALEGGGNDSGSDNLSGGDGTDSLQGSGGNDVLKGERGQDSLAGGGDADALAGGDGNDTMRGGPGIDSLAGGTGNDDINGSDVVLIGIDERDTLQGNEGDDSLAGGDGNDTLDGGSGVDVMAGGSGQDTVSYESAKAPVTVVLDGRPNDGAAGESDNVRTDVEDVSGGGVDDTFTGDRSRNQLVGGSGEDYLDGASGADTLSGGEQADVVRARDGVADTVECGRNTDFAIVDRKDRVARSCERKDTGLRNRPNLGKDVVVQPRAGTNEFGLPQMQRTVPLEDRINLPVSSRIDSTDGRVKLTSLRRAGKKVRSQAALFYDGAFKVAQGRGRNPLTELQLEGGNFRQCRASSSSQVGTSRSSKKKVRELWGNGRGRFRTRGRYSETTVRGTVWLTEDRCDGTFTRVRRGTAVVYDCVRRRSVVVRAGQSYLAKAGDRHC